MGKIVKSKKYRENNKKNETFKPKSNKLFGSSRKMILIKKKVISEHDDCSVLTSSTVSLSSLESTSSLNSSFSDDSIVSQAQIIIEEGETEMSNKKYNIKSKLNKKPKKKKNKKPKKEKKAIEISDEEKEQYLAMDCEMVGIGPSGFASAVARVSIVNW